AAALADRLGVEARIIGAPGGEPTAAGWEAQVRAGRGCLLEAGGQVDDALGAGRFPVLVHGDCAIGMTTLPAVHRNRPDARVLWLDAHGDFNTPDTSPSGWLGGMALAGACGLWDPGVAPPPPCPPDRVVLCGVRDLDDGERELLERAPVTVVGAALETLVYLQNALDGAPTYVHLDPDVLDPSVFPAQFPVDGGLSAEKLYDLLDAVADASEVVGLEVASFCAPADPAELERCVDLLAGAVRPLLDASRARPSE
ncbi:MAG: arginase family protein, partial [Actinomycetota bacterium]|nr:arginase family protein [Actinomycetota bacterium]